MGYAFHSRQMEPFQEELIRALRSLRPQAPRLPIFSALSGGRAGEGDYGPDYWARGIRERVRFGEALCACAREGRGVFLEVGPHPVLGPMIRRCGAAAGGQLAPVASLRRGVGEVRAMVETMGRLYCLGHAVDWSCALPPGGRAVSLPNYPWQRKRHWIEAGGEAGRRERESERRVHPLLGRRVALDREAVSK